VPESRVTQVPVEVIGQPPPSRARITQVAVEAAGQPPPSRGRITQVAVEGIYETPQTAEIYITQQAVEVLAPWKVWIPQIYRVKRP
jgi:hypothetical protein